MKQMSTLKHTHYYFISMWLAYTCSSIVATYDSLPRNPLLGSPQKWPTVGSGWGWNFSGGGVRNNEALTRLLDVGALTSGSDYISFVPPLDGTSPVDTLSQDNYAMQIVLFDFELVELKSVDPVGGSFEVEFQMLLHWVESVKNGSEGAKFTDECKFPCGTKSRTPLCCDEVWVPPLALPRCDINEIQSSTPTPYIYTWFGDTKLSYNDCFRKENEGSCVWRRFWYLNIDATCANDMNFRNFPFDVQLLNIDILNPYASRTWFQLTKGFLQANIGENINTVSLSPDAKIPGWYVKDVLASGNCGISKNWKQTFLTQDTILKALNDTYVSQKDIIAGALDSDALTCTTMEDYNTSTSGMDLLSPGLYNLYKTAWEKYSERVNETLKTYEQCSKDHGIIYYWNLTSYNETTNKTLRDFDISSANIKRSFNILDLMAENASAHVYFPCAISAIANLTSPGIQVTIIVRRYKLYYTVKLLLPTIACVVFSFTAFGLRPKDLVGRLTVVVPSAIALTALQALVVSTDIPPVAYIAPSTLVFIWSYFVQIIISIESVVVSWLSSKPSHWSLRCCTRRRKNNPYPFTMDSLSNGPFERLSSDASREMSNRGQDAASTKETSIELSRTVSTQEIVEPKSQEESEVSNVESHKSLMSVRKLDLSLCIFLILIYIVAISLCILIPMHRSNTSQSKHSNGAVVLLWK